LNGDARGSIVPKRRVSSFAVSIDGFGAGPDQDVENPIGQGGEGRSVVCWD